MAILTIAGADDVMDVFLQRAGCDRQRAKLSKLKHSMSIHLISRYVDLMARL